MARMVKPPKMPDGSAKFPQQSRNIWLIAIPIILLVAVLMGLLVYKIAFRKQGPLPATQAETGPPLPAPPALPAVSQTGPAPPALPDIKKPEGEQAPITAAPPPKAPEQAGNVVWRWAMYAVSPEIGIPGFMMAVPPSPGCQYAALGVTITNGSTVSIDVKHDDFRLDVDGQVYPAERMASAATLGQMTFLAESTLRPGASMNGCLGFMIPQRYRKAMAEWQPVVPEGVKVVRTDPPSTQPQPTAASTAPPRPAPSSGEDE